MVKADKGRNDSVKEPAAVFVEKSYFFVFFKRKIGMSSYSPDKPISSTDGQASGGMAGTIVAPGSAGFQAKYVARDVQAGIICGAMAIPLSTGIAMMSEYPIKVALATVVFACFIGWVNSFFRPGNYIGVPGVAAGLAPALALGVQSFGVENMAFCIFLTAAIQAVVWKYNWQRYIILAVPVYLVEGLLA